MGDEAKKRLTGGEILIVLGKTAIKAGESLEDDGRLDVGEITQIITTLANEAWTEYND